MKREIKTLDQLKIQADCMRLGRVEQAITESIIMNHDYVFIRSHLYSDFVAKNLSDGGYDVSPGSKGNKFMTTEEDLGFIIYLK